MFLLRLKGAGMRNKILVRDIKQAERDYAVAMTRWGENNLVTVRAAIKLHELRERKAKEGKS